MGSSPTLSVSFRGVSSVGRTLLLHSRGHGFDSHILHMFFNISIMIIFSLALAGIILGASYFLALQSPDPEKISVYECGFEPFGDTRKKFEVRFFLVGILFIIFDLEISFLVP